MQQHKQEPPAPVTRDGRSIPRRRRIRYGCRALLLGGLLLVIQGCVGIREYPQLALHVNGKLLSPDGKPVPGAEIRFLRPRGDMAMQRAGSWLTTPTFHLDVQRGENIPGAGPLASQPCGVSDAVGGMSGYVTTAADGTFAANLPQWKSHRVAVFGLPAEKGCYLLLRLPGQAPISLGFQGNECEFYRTAHDKGTSSYGFLARAPMPDWLVVNTRVRRNDDGTKVQEIILRTAPPGDANPARVPGCDEAPEVFTFVRAGKEHRGECRVVTIPLDDTTTLELVWIAPGTFRMGSPPEEEGRDTGGMFDREVLHEVELSNGYYIGRHEVTRGQFKAFVDATGYLTLAERNTSDIGPTGAFGVDAETGEFVGPDRRYNWRAPGFEQTDEHPVVNLAVDDALEFCRWLTEKFGNEGTARLPTEAEWEYACRAGTSTRFCSADGFGALELVGNAQARGASADKAPFTSPVGSLSPNAWGIYDMHGNAEEWVADCFGSYELLPQKDPLRTEPDMFTPTAHVLRGGGWQLPPEFCRSACRSRFKPPSSRFPYLGFRVVVSAYR